MRHEKPHACKTFCNSSNNDPCDSLRDRLTHHRERNHICHGDLRFYLDSSKLPEARFYFLYFKEEDNSVGSNCLAIVVLHVYPA